MKKPQTIILFLMIASTCIFAQKTNYNQNLEDLIGKNKWFEVEQYYQKYKDSIDSKFTNLLYQAKTGTLFNNSTQSINAYEKLLNENFLKMNTPNLISQFGQPLLQIYADEHKYDKGKELCDKMINILKKDTVYDLTDYIQGLQNAKQIFSKWNGQIVSVNMIDTTPNTDVTLPLIRRKSDNGIYFNARWNGVNLRTYFDTGAGSCFIVNRKIAKKIGVKINSTDTILMNGNIKGVMGIVDSLTFGTFKANNVNVFVNVDEVNHNNIRQSKCDSTLNSMFDIVLGMPIIKQLGNIEFDFQNSTMSFIKNKKTLQQRNMYIKEGTLYLNMKIDNANFLTCFDTGGKEGLYINTDFYTKHQQYFKLVTQATEKKGSVGGCNETSLYTIYKYDCPQIDIQIDNTKLRMLNDCEVAKNKENNFKYGTIEGGFLGNKIFKYCSKATFDFKNMRFDVKKK